MLFLPIREEAQVNSPCVFTVDEVTQFIDAFLTAVGNPSNPNCCPYCFAALAFDLAINNAALYALQRHGYAFWEKCITLIVDYTKVDIPRLRTRLRQNQMTCKDRSTYHTKRLPYTFSDPFDLFINALFFSIGTGLTKGKRPAYSEGKLAKVHYRKGYWPCNLNDLFPMDIDRVLDGILHWVCAPSSPFPLSVLNTYLLVARAVVFPVLMEQPRRDRLAWALLQVMTPDHPTVPWHGAAPFTVPAGLCVPRMLRRDSLLCDMALYTLRIVRLDTHARTDDDAVFFAGHERLFLDALDRMDLNARPVVLFVPQYDGYRRTALEMRVEAVREYQCVLRGLLGREHDDCGHSTQTMQSRTTFMYNFLTRRLESTYCFNPTCERAELDKYQTTRPFQKCGKCHIARYCSHECQKQDWSQNEPKHKEICKAISELGRCMAQGKADEVDFTAKFDETELFTSEKVAELVEWAMASRLVPRCRFPATN